MVLEKEEQNFVKLAKVILDIIPKHLRIYFVGKWNSKFSQKWNSDGESGTIIQSNIPKKNRNSSYRSIEKKLLYGDEEKWDTTVLMFVLLFSGLELIEDCRKKEERNDPLRESEEIDKIREIRNSCFAHAESMRCPDSEFEKMIGNIKFTVERLFGHSARAEICDIESSSIGNKITNQLREQLEEQIRCNETIQEMVSNFTGKCIIIKSLHFYDKLLAIFDMR